MGIRFKARNVEIPAGESVLISPENTNRRYLGILNMDAGDLKLSFDAPPGPNTPEWAVAPAGAPEGQGGGITFEVLAPSNPIFGTSILGTTVCVLEG